METVKISIKRFETLIEKQVKYKIQIENLLEQTHNNRIYIQELETSLEDLQAEVEHLRKSLNVENEVFNRD